MSHKHGSEEPGRDPGSPGILADRLLKKTSCRDKDENGAIDRDLSWMLQSIGSLTLS